MHGEGPDGRLTGFYRVNKLPPSFQERLAYFGVSQDWHAALAGEQG